MMTHASHTLCFSSEPKLRNINNSSTAVKCRFQNAVNVSQEEMNLSRFPSSDSSKQSYIYFFAGSYSSKHREECTSLMAYVNLRGQPSGGEGSPTCYVIREVLYNIVSITLSDK